MGSVGNFHLVKVLSTDLGLNSGSPSRALQHTFPSSPRSPRSQIPTHTLRTVRLWPICQLRLIAVHWLPWNWGRPWRPPHATAHCLSCMWPFRVTCVFVTDRPLERVVLLLFATQLYKKCNFVFLNLDLVAQRRSTKELPYLSSIDSSKVQFI